MMSHYQLEEIAIRITQTQKANGVLMLIFYQDTTRCEMISTVRRDKADTVKMLRRLADEVEGGSGMPLGRHGTSQG